MVQRFTIHGRLDGMNDFIYACRSNRYVGNEMKRENQAVVSKEIIAAGLKPFKGMVTIEYIFYEPNMRRDPDNVSGFAHKVVQDALVECGILENDGWKNISGYRDIFSVNKDNPRIDVIISGVY